MYAKDRAPIGTLVKTGSVCPESGVWKAEGYNAPDAEAPIAKGNRMPPYRGTSVNWRLMRYA